MALTLDRTRRKPGSRVASLNGDEQRVWSVVLAGGEGIRLRPLTRYVSGDQRPKPYARLLGSRSLLQQTIDRVTLTIPLERTVVLGLRSHLEYLGEEFSADRPRILMQPENRGTAAAILLAVHWISWRDPAAIVVVCPVDHFIRGEMALMSHVMSVAAFVRDSPERLVLLAAPPTEPDPHYGWIETGEILGRVATEPVFRVQSFREKPGAEVARELFAGGHLVNTFILVATASLLAETGRRLLPVLSEWFQRVAPFANTEDEGLAIAEAYARAPTVDFSRGILEACPPCLAAVRLPAGVTWSDWETPSRVIRSLRNAGLVPRWLPDVEVDRVDPGAETRVMP